VHTSDQKDFLNGGFNLTVLPSHYVTFG